MDQPLPIQTALIADRATAASVGDVRPAECAVEYGRIGRRLALLNREPFVR